MAILDFLDELESIFRHPVHLCDVKASHFGISDDGKIKFLDLDAVFQKSVLGKLHQMSDFNQALNLRLTLKQKISKTHCIVMTTHRRILLG